MTRTLAALLVLAAAGTAHAGHSRFPYFDGGHSTDGRYTVAVELVVEAPAGKKAEGSAAHILAHAQFP